MRGIFSFFIFLAQSSRHGTHGEPNVVQTSQKELKTPKIKYQYMSTIIWFNTKFRKIGMGTIVGMGLIPLEISGALRCTQLRQTAQEQQQTFSGQHAAARPNSADVT